MTSRNLAPLGAMLGTLLWVTGVHAQVSSNHNLIDISLDGLFAVGGSSAGPDAIKRLQGGGHDPAGRGFTVQNLELSLVGAVDPYFSAEAHIIFLIDSEGESRLELEEAFLVTQSLPWGFQIKGGMFFTEFGRLNPQHPHTWDFVDQPVINSRLLGPDGLRNPGLRVSYVLPVSSWWSELVYSVQRARGETAASFIGSEHAHGESDDDEDDHEEHEDEDESDSEHADELPRVERPTKTARDLLHTLRWLNSLSPSDSVGLNLGLSAAIGPNATGLHASTLLVGADFYLRWQPVESYKGWPFVSLQSEVMARQFEVGSTGEKLKDYGLYAQATWGFTYRWVTAIRYDYARQAESHGPAHGDLRHRGALNLSFFPTEFSKIRLQYNYDRTEDLMKGHAHSLWLQFEFLLGAHGAHAF